MSSEWVTLSYPASDVVVVTLTRPDKLNALTGDMVGRITTFARELDGLWRRGQPDHGVGPLLRRHHERRRQPAHQLGAVSNRFTRLDPCLSVFIRSRTFQWPRFLVAAFFSGRVS